MEELFTKEEREHAFGVITRLQSKADEIESECKRLDDEIQKLKNQKYSLEADLTSIHSSQENIASAYGFWRRFVEDSHGNSTVVGYSIEKIDED